MPLDRIIVRGAREHNLQNITVEIPRDRLAVLTGISGSGKSSLAFDTIYAEGQRKYVESLSAYARQFLGLMEKPDVDHIEGLSPAVSIDQKGAPRNPRSTVGTVTEVYDYLRLLYARIGVPHCPKCGKPITRQTPEPIVDHVLASPTGIVGISVVDGEEHTFSQNYACPDGHDVTLPEIEPRIFSFNAPYGACPTCTGLGFKQEIDPDLVLDPSLSLLDGAVLPWASSTSEYYQELLRALADR